MTMSKMEEWISRQSKKKGKGFRFKTNKITFARDVVTPAADKKKSQIYTKMLFEVTRATKLGGEDPETNFLLRVALSKCKKKYP